MSTSKIPWLAPMVLPENILRSFCTYHCLGPGDATIPVPSSYHSLKLVMVSKLGAPMSKSPKGHTRSTSNTQQKHGIQYKAQLLHW